jgi:hypothetical protein
MADIFGVCHACKSHLPNGYVGPCPYCGEVIFDIALQAADDIPITAIDTAKVRLISTSVLASARRLITDGQYQAAVLVALMACEVVIGDVIVRLMEQRGLKAVRDWAEEYKEGFSFGNSAIRALYFSLSGELIRKSFPRWKEYDRHVDLRNKVAHRGRPVTKIEAEQVCEVAEALVAHLSAVREDTK